MDRLRAAEAMKIKGKGGLTLQKSKGRNNAGMHPKEAGLERHSAVSEAFQQRIGLKPSLGDNS